MDVTETNDDVTRINYRKGGVTILKGVRRVWPNSAGVRQEDMGAEYAIKIESFDTTNPSGLDRGTAQVNYPASIVLLRDALSELIVQWKLESVIESKRNKTLSKNGFTWGDGLGFQHHEVIATDEEEN